MQHIIWFKDSTIEDISVVGGKNASLAQMYNSLNLTGIKVPNGFATTVAAFDMFLSENKLKGRIDALLSDVHPSNLSLLSKRSAEIKNLIISSKLPNTLVQELKEAYLELGAQSVAVRSSATAEDLPDASFAGQQESYLNVSGIENLLDAVKNVYASLYNERAISYRLHKGFVHADIGISVGIQKMVRSDIGSSGVMFTIDTESGFDKLVLINSTVGLGESLVQGEINPDEFYLYKPALSVGNKAIIKKSLGSKKLKIIANEINETKDKKAGGIATVPTTKQEQETFSISEEEAIELGLKALIIENHYGKAMDIEWAKDGVTNELFIVQARPETVASKNLNNKVIEKYELLEQGEELCSGCAVGQKIASGRARLLKSPKEIDKLQEGDILVTDMTDPDWEPIMKKASAIVTDRGGRTCHAAIIARELGIAALVGCNNATEVIKDGDEITVSCAQGSIGNVYIGKKNFRLQQTDLSNLAKPPVDLLLNLGNPQLAFSSAKLPCSGVGLARLEFIINNTIGIHPKACLDYSLLNKELKAQIDNKIKGYADAKSFYINKLKEGISTIAAAFYPKKVIVRLSDFKTNEYANMLGGSIYEPLEENPMLGFRGAARYLSDEFKDCFELECIALKEVREEMGLENIEIMVPFVRTLEEARGAINLLADFGLKRGENGLKIIMMCELPANAVLAEEFLKYFDGFSIGSNDLTQLSLGIDRDSGLLSNSFKESNLAVKALISLAIKQCKKQNKYIGICGQGPSDDPQFASWLIENEIDSLSLNPDSVLKTWMHLSEAKEKVLGD